MRRFPYALLGLLAVQAGAEAQSAPAVLSRVKDAYARINTYSEVVGVSFSEKIGGSRLQGGLAVKMRYAKPNRIFVEISGPQLGTFVASSDGRTQTIYRSEKNLYSRKKAPATLKGFVETLRAEKFASEMDPLYFLMGAPDGYPGNLVYNGKAVVNGRPVQIVKGTYRSKSVSPGSTGKVTLWADDQTGLLAKIRIEFLGVTRIVTATGMRNGKPVVVNKAVKSDRTIDLVMHSFQANPALSDADFAYTPPKGAVEQQIDKLLGR